MALHFRIMFGKGLPNSGLRQKAIRKQLTPLGSQLSSQPRKVRSTLQSTPANFALTSLVSATLAASTRFRPRKKVAPPSVQTGCCHPRSQAGQFQGAREQSFGSEGFVDFGKIKRRFDAKNVANFIFERSPFHCCVSADAEECFAPMRGGFGAVGCGASRRGAVPCGAVRCGARGARPQLLRPPIRGAEQPRRGLPILSVFFFLLTFLWQTLVGFR